MEPSEQERQDAEARSAALTDAGHAVAARYDRRSDEVIVDLHTGVQLVFKPALIEDLADAKPDDLAEIEVSFTGLGLHWPRIDADVYVPGLLRGLTGSKRWMAAQLGATGGKARSPAKAAAARENGRKGGRPKRAA